MQVWAIEADSMSHPRAVGEQTFYPLYLLRGTDKAVRAAYQAINDILHCRRNEVNACWQYIVPQETSTRG